MSSTSSFAISGDEQERERIKLERNLLALDHHAQPIFYEDEAEAEAEFDEYASIEQPRRRPGDSSREISISRIRSIRSHGGEDDLGTGQDSEIRAWSYRSDFSVDEDEEGVDPYAAHAPRVSPRNRTTGRDQPSGYTNATASTAQHHASALTMNAGLGGKETARRRRNGGNRVEHTATTASMSGAEYDPDRPIYDMLARVGQDWEKGMRTYDPVVVDNSGDIDAILSSRAHSESARKHRPLSPTPSSSSLSSSTSRPMRPSAPAVKSRLSASAGPRLPSASVSQPPPTRASKTRQQYHPSPYEQHMPTPKQHRVSFSVAAPPTTRGHAPAPAQKAGTRRPPQAGYVEASPASAMKKTGTRRREDGRLTTTNTNHNNNHNYAPPQPSKLQRNNSYSMRHLSPAPPHHKRMQDFASPGGHSIQLPDFTGITTAIESPAPVRIVLHATGPPKKNHLGGGVGYKQYPQPPSHSNKENAILSTLNSLRKRLTALEEENVATRRRVCDLEGELRRVKARTRNPNASFDDRQERHALESLIESLHDHLDRLSKETTEQGKVLGMLLKLIRPMSGLSEQLANQRMNDSFKDQGDRSNIFEEVSRLRTHVERLTGEVEALREVVEEGLRGRDESEEDTSDAPSEEERDDTDVEAETEDPVDLQDSRAPTDIEDSNGLSQQGPIVLTEDPQPSPLPPPRSSKQTHGRVRMTLRSPDASVSRSLTEEFERCKTKDPEPAFKLQSTSRYPPMRTSTPPPLVSEPPRPTAATGYDKKSRTAAGEHRVPLDDASLVEPPARKRDYLAPALDNLPERNDRLCAPEIESEVSLDSRFMPKHPLPSGSNPTVHADPRRYDQPEHEHEQQGANEQRVPEPKLRTAKLEKMFRDAPDHDAERCTACKRSDAAEALHSRRVYREKAAARNQEGTNDDRLRSEKALLERILQELQDDFSHYKSVYIDISSQYEQLDAISNVPQRNALARHLHDIIDILEHKGDQIASLTESMNTPGAFENILKARIVPLVPSVAA